MVARFGLSVNEEALNVWMRSSNWYSVSLPSHFNMLGIHHVPRVYSILPSGFCSATPLPLTKLAKGFPLIASFNGFTSVRSCRAAAASSSAPSSTSRGLGFHKAMIWKAGKSTGSGTLNFFYPNKPMHNIALAAKSARRLVTRTEASRQQYHVPQQPETVPLWLWICLASSRAVKDALQFLWEQPGQLKDIEWPSLHVTIRMSVLTVVVVALLIIFLTTIDSTFSYLLSSVLRRVP